MLGKRRGSVDVTALADFEPNLEEPKFTNWYSDLPASEWEGVVSSTPRDEILEIDLAILDRDLQVRHRLPNLTKMSFPASVTKVHLAYIQKVHCRLFSIFSPSTICSKHPPCYQPFIKNLPPSAIVELKTPILFVAHNPVFFLQVAKDYQYHELSFDVSGRDDVNDATLKVIGDAGVGWHEIVLKDCFVITEEGVATLKKACPEMNIT